jgi:hypothetical protein
MNVASRWQQTLPPAAAPIYPEAGALNINPALRAEVVDSLFRCASCNQWTPKGAWLVWVPDSARIGDPAWSIIELARTTAYNGCGSGWCLNCAQKLSSPAPSVKAAVGFVRRMIEKLSRTGI